MGEITIIPKDKIMQAAKWDGKGRPPAAISKEVKVVNEQRRVSRVKKNRKGQIVQVDKMDLFLNEFLRNGGNATQAALTVLNSPSVESAAIQGSRYLKKARLLGIGRVIMEKQGLTYEKMLEHAGQKMLASDKVDWFDRLMKIGGFEEFGVAGKNQGPSIVNIVQTQKELAQEFGFEDAEVIEPEEDES